MNSVTPQTPATSGNPQGIDPAELNQEVTKDEAEVVDLMFSYTEDEEAYSVVDEVPASSETELRGRPPEPAPLVDPAQPPQQVQPPATQEAVPPQQVQQPAVAPQTPAVDPAVQPGVQGQQQPQVAAPAQPQQAPGQELSAVVQAMEANREKFVEAATQAYMNTFSDADVEEIQENPKAAFSKMAARLHADIAQNVMGMVASQIPQVVRGMQVAQREQDAQEDAFFGEHADLKPYRQQVLQAAAVLRQFNPTMPAAQFGPLLAATVRAQYNLRVQPQQQQPPQPPPRRQTGFQPAPPGGGSPAPAYDPQNPWGQVHDILDADDNGMLDMR